LTGHAICGGGGGVKKNTNNKQINKENRYTVKHSDNKVSHLPLRIISNVTNLPETKKNFAEDR
jgi:hypothetical protein